MNRLSMAPDRQQRRPGDCAAFAPSLNDATRVTATHETGTGQTVGRQTADGKKKISASKAAPLSVAPMMDGSDLVGVSVG